MKLYLLTTLLCFLFLLKLNGQPNYESNPLEPGYKWKLAIDAGIVRDYNTFSNFSFKKDTSFKQNFSNNVTQVGLFANIAYKICEKYCSNSYISIEGIFGVSDPTLFSSVSLNYQDTLKNVIIDSSGKIGDKINSKNLDINYTSFIFEINLIHSICISNELNNYMNYFFKPGFVATFPSFNIKSDNSGGYIFSKSPYFSFTISLGMSFYFGKGITLKRIPYLSWIPYFNPFAQVKFYFPQSHNRNDFNGTWKTPYSIELGFRFCFYQNN